MADCASVDARLLDIVRDFNALWESIDSPPAGRSGCGARAANGPRARAQRIKLQTALERDKQIGRAIRAGCRTIQEIDYDRSE